MMNIENDGINLRVDIESWNMLVQIIKENIKHLRNYRICYTFFLSGYTDLNLKYIRYYIRYLTQTINV